MSVPFGVKHCAATGVTKTLSSMRLMRVETSAGDMRMDDLIDLGLEGAIFRGRSTCVCTRKQRRVVIEQQRLARRWPTLGFCVVTHALGETWNYRHRRDE